MVYVLLDLLDPHEAWRLISAPQIRFLADPSGTFTKSLELSFLNENIFGHERSKRYALVIENGKVKKMFVEPDATGVDGEFASLGTEESR